MIQGRVNAGFEVMVRLVIRGTSGRAREVEAVIDTGFNGFLSLPPTLATELGLPLIERGQVLLADGSEVWLNVYAVFVEWDGRRRYVKADATGKIPMVGMSLLHRHNLYVEVVEGGMVAIDARN